MTARPAAEQARESVLRQYAAAHDYWSEKDQINAHYLALNLIDPEVAVRDHEMAQRCLRAYRMELDDPGLPLRFDDEGTLL